MSDVFISYSRTNKDDVRRFAEAIEADGFDVWWDADLPPHKAYSDVITEEIAKAKAVVVFWSEDAAKSQWVRAEADIARNAGKLIQATIEAGFVPPIPFNQMQVADVSDWRGQLGQAEWEKVRSAILSLLNGGAGQRVVPPLPRRRSPTRAGSIAIVALALAGLSGVGWLGWQWMNLGETSTQLSTQETTPPPPTPTTQGAAAPLGGSMSVEARELAKQALALLLNRGVAPVCGGYYLSGAKVVFPASCATENIMGAYGWSSDIRLFGVNTAGGAALVGANSAIIGVYGGPRIPPFADELAPGAVVFVGALVEQGPDPVFSPACTLGAAGPDGLYTSSCSAIGELPGATVFDPQGRVAGMVLEGGQIAPLSVIRAEMLRLGVADPSQ